MARPLAVWPSVAVGNLATRGFRAGWSLAIRGRAKVSASSHRSIWKAKRIVPCFARQPLGLGGVEALHVGIRKRRHPDKHAVGPSGPLATISVMYEPDLAELKVPVAVRERVSEILAITDDACVRHLDDEYARLCRVLVARLARKRPSPLTRGDVRIWAAGAIYAVGQVNFLFDRTQWPHLTADQLARHLGVVKTTMANKAGLINRTLDLGLFEPDLTRTAMLEQHPVAWLVSVNGFIVDARTLPDELQEQARRRGLIPDLDAGRAA